MRININAYARLARFDKLAGAWLLLLPCWWGLALAGYHGVLYLLFAVGAVIMRGAGCVINDMADRKFDVQVERTKTRPLASGEIGMFGASIFLLSLLLIGLFILLILPHLAILVGLASVPLFIIYPFTKRFSYWPQVFLGLTFNIGILVAYATIKDTLSLPAFIFYFAAVFWTLGYDTIYAHQDKIDDIKIGVKSTALALGDKTKTFVALFYTAFILLILIAVYLEHPLRPAFLIMWLLAALQLHWQVWKLNINDRENCLRMFKSNIYAGLLILFALWCLSL